jgi:Leucine Rich repeats (2 copies)
MKKYRELKFARTRDGMIGLCMVRNACSALAFIFALLVCAFFVIPTAAQEIFIPDPDLNAAIREALQKPAGPITQQDMLNLTELNACCRNVTSLEGLETASNLTVLTIQFNHLTSFSLPAGLTKLNTLDISSNPLTNCVLPSGLTNLTTLLMEGDGLTNLILPGGMTHLVRIELAENHFASLNLPEGLTNLTILDLTSNQLASLTLPPDITKLNSLIVEGNPLATLVLSEPLAATNLAAEIAQLQNQGVSVFTYPLIAQLVRPLPLTGAFKIGITGPPAVYSVLGSTNLTVWNEVGVVTNPLGSVNFVDVTAHLSPQKFYRVEILQ